VASASEYLAIRTGADGRREEKLDEVSSALARSARRLRRRLGKAWGRIAGMGLAAQGGSGAIVDGRTGRSFTPLYLWNDARAAAFMPRIIKGRPASFWRRRTLRDLPGAGLARLLWLRKERPALFAKRNMYVGAGEFAFFRLTGVWRQDACNALQIGCYNARRDCLDAGLLALAGVPLSFVAPLRSGHERHPLSAAGASLLGLPAGIPVAGPYMDHEAGYLSAAGVSRRPLACSLGTAWVGNFVLGDRERWRSPVQLVLPAPVGAGRLVVQPLLTGNVTWDWALANFVHPDRGEALARLEAVFDRALLPPEGLLALPWLNVRNPLQPGRHGGAGFFGMAPQTGREDLLRAVAAGMACEMYRVFAGVKRLRKVDAVVLGGGASKGRFFRTLLAALFAPLPVYRLADEDVSGARGTLYAFSPKASRSRAERVAVPPRALKGRILEHFERYREIFGRLYAGTPAGGAVTFAGKESKR
jgi:gluconokinase